MKEYEITIKDRSYNIVIKKLQTDSAIVEVNGEEYEVGVQRKVKRQTEPLEVKPVRTATPTTEPSSPKSAIAKTAETADAVVAPLPGLILSILVSEGDRVKAGEIIIKMETMKMENEIKANKTGKVEKIYVTESESVLENAPLVKIGD